MTKLNKASLCIFSLGAAIDFLVCFIGPWTPFAFGLLCFQLVCICGLLTIPARAKKAEICWYSFEKRPCPPEYWNEDVLSPAARMVLESQHRSLVMTFDRFVKIK
jgi:hypothetical protein